MSSTPSSHKSSPVKLAEPRIEQKKVYVIAGLREKYSAETVNNIPALWARLAPHFGQLPAQVGGAAYGLGIDMFDQCGSFEYLAGVEVNDTSKLPDGWTSVTIPAQKYAVFPHDGHVSQLKETVHAILHQWLPDAGKKLRTPAPKAVDFLEYYAPEFDPRTGMGGMQVWLALG